MRIYTITTVRGFLAGGSRAVGYFEDFQTAEEAILDNEFDINEMGYYPYAVIEEVTPGIYSFPRKEYWYKWDNDNEGYNTCEKPERFNSTCLWSLG